MATVYRIHPAIGIARVGNSDEFFIGPERVGQRPEPAGGFKDAQCRVKRQAARFRIFAHHDNGTVEEITDADATIAWTVHLANRKASYPGRGNSEPAGDLNIDPGARSTNGPNQQRLFDSGTIRFSGQSAITVPLGEMRSDTENRLLVLAGAGHSASPAGNGIGNFWANAGWYDDIADGPVSATITLRADNSSPPVVGAVGRHRAAEVRAAPGHVDDAVRPAAASDGPSRLAGTHASMMLGVLQTNRENVLHVLQGMQSQLSEMELALSSNDDPKLEFILNEAQRKYQALTQ